jgi:hypothetical protein
MVAGHDDRKPPARDREGISTASPAEGMNHGTDPARPLKSTEAGSSDEIERPAGHGQLS